MAERTVQIRFDGTARGLEKAANNAARKLDKFGDQASGVMEKAGSDSGRSFFRRFMSSAGNMALGGMSSLATKLGTGLSRAVMSNPWIGGAIAAGIVAVAVPAMAAAGATIGAALVSAVGAGIAGLGVLVQAQTDKVKQEAKQLKKDVTSTLQDISQPIQRVILNVFKEVRGLVDFFAPTLEKAFKSMEGPLNDFFNNLFQAFKELKPAIQPAVDAFNTLLDAIGPMLPKVARMVANGIKDIATTIKNNPGAFKKLVTFLIALIPMFIEWVNLMTELWVFFSKTLPNAIQGFVKKLRKWFTAAKNFLRNKVWKPIENAAVAAWNWIKTRWSEVTGFFSGIGNDISNALGSALNWVEQRFTDAKNWITGLFNDIGGFFSGVWGSIVSGLRSAVNWIIGIINDVTGSINSAIGAVNNVPGVSIPEIPNIPRLQEGGSALAGQTYLVGEKGPELFTPNQSGTVTPNDELSSAGGPQVVENHIEIGGEVVRVVRSEIRSNNQKLRSAVTSGAGGSR